MQSNAFWGLRQQENQRQFKAACLHFSRKSTQFTRILVESSNVHNFFFQNTCLHAKRYVDSKVFYLKILSDNVSRKIIQWIYR